MLDILLPLGTIALFGFTGSLHCAAMCSAIVGCCQNKTHSYFLARSISYTILGLLAGLLGLGFFKNFLGMSSHTLSIFIALICLIQIIFIIKPNFFNFAKRKLVLGKMVNGIMKYSPLPRSATFGVMTALLPCGFLYAALLFSVSFADPFISAASMLVFSLVTTPALLGGKGVLMFVAHKFHRIKKGIFCILLLVAASLSLMRGGVFSPGQKMENKIMCHPHM